AGIFAAGQGAQDLSELGGAELARSTGAARPLGEAPDPFPVVCHGLSCRLWKELWKLATGLAGAGQARRAPVGPHRGAPRRSLVAVPLEEGPVLDDQLRRYQRTLDLGPCQQLDLLPALHLAADGAPDRDHAAVDLGVDHAGLADDQQVVGDDLALDAPVDAERVAKAQLPEKLRALIQEPVQLLGAKALDLDHRPSRRPRRLLAFKPSTPGPGASDLSPGAAGARRGG